MKLISHRGLLDGPDPLLENHPDQIRKVLDQQLDVEVDVWLTDKGWFLGHDAPQYSVGHGFLNLPGLWIHAKNFDAAHRLLQLSKFGNNFNFFWHESDERTLTSSGHWWTYPNKALNTTSVAVMPEVHVNLTEFRSILTWNCYGVCTDWISLLR